MRISDWSSDVCSSGLDMAGWVEAGLEARGDFYLALVVIALELLQAAAGVVFRVQRPWLLEIGRGSCRERVCQYVSISGVAVSLHKTTTITQRYQLFNTPTTSVVFPNTPHTIYT